MMLKNKKVLIGITGGIAFYRIFELISILKKEGALVKIILTKSALKFVTPLAFKGAIDAPHSVYTDVDFFNDSLLHIDLAKWADIFVIAPITANTIGKIALGLADNLLLNCCLAFNKKVLIVPAMNPTMWSNVSVVKNIEFLKQTKVEVVGPIEGNVICGDFGIGRMVEVMEVYNAIINNIYPKPLQNKNIIITAGPTIEEIDGVRYISNYSSGKMGYELAKVASYLGGNVTLVSGPSNLDIPFNCHIIKVKSAQMMEKVTIESSQNSDIVMMAAAVADFRPLNQISGKLSKEQMGTFIPITPNNDILATLTQLNPKPFYVGFAIQDNDLIPKAKEKLYKKNIDVIIANEISNYTGFNTDTNAVSIITKDQIKKIPLMEKKKIALAIWVEILELFLASNKYIN